MFEAEPTLYLGTLLYFVLIMLTVSLIIFTMFTAVLTNFFLQQVKEGDEDEESEDEASPGGFRERHSSATSSRMFLEKYISKNNADRVSHHSEPVVVRQST